MILLIVAVEQASKDEPKLSTLFLFKIIIVGCGAIEKRQEQGSRGLRVMMETEKRGIRGERPVVVWGYKEGVATKRWRKRLQVLVCVCVCLLAVFASWYRWRGFILLYVSVCVCLLAGVGLGVTEN